MTKPVMRTGVRIFCRFGRSVRRCAAILLILVLTVLTDSGPAYAFNGNAAAAYAEQYAINRNTYYPNFGSDCTNFVSQALHASYPYRNYGVNAGDDHNWWYIDVPHYTYSWNGVVHLWNFLAWTYPGGVPSGGATGSATNAYTPSTVVTGDLIFYDWTSDNNLDHVAIQVGWGTDPVSGWYGNYVDQHTTNRYHAFWSLRPYNSQYATTTVRFMHIDARN